MKKKKLLICGATGFIGRNLCQRLAQKAKFELYGTYFKSPPLKLAGIKMLKADLTRDKDVRRVIKGMDIILQAAANTSGVKDTITQPHIHVTDNAVMNSLILRAAHEYRISHFVFFSCSVMYQPGKTAAKENDFDANQEIYPAYFGVGWTKVYIEKMCRFYSRIGNTRYTAIRHSNIYGPYDKFGSDKSHLFAALISKVMQARSGKITLWGSGEEERGLLYVSDLLDFVEIILKKQKVKFELCNAGYGSSISVKQLAEKIVRHSGKKIKIAYDLSRPTIKTKLSLDISRARGIYGWSPKVSLEEGIKKTLYWYEEKCIK